MSSNFSKGLNINEGQDSKRKIRVHFCMHSLKFQHTKLTSNVILLLQICAETTDSYSIKFTHVHVYHMQTICIQDVTPVADLSCPKC